MDAERMLLTAISLQRAGTARAAIETALFDLARREGTPCQMRRDFAGHGQLLFADGHCLRCDGEVWSLHQQEHSAPLYADALEPFMIAPPGAAADRGRAR